MKTGEILSYLWRTEMSYKRLPLIPLPPSPAGEGEKFLLEWERAFYPDLL
jgi:hypothetical protein